MTNWYVIVPAALLLAYFLASRGGKVPSEKAKELVKNGAKLIDVRTRAEFQGGHLEGAINIPVQELETRLKDAGPKEATYVVYCASGMRSGRAKGILKASGRTEVYDLGAMSRW